MKKVTVDGNEACSSISYMFTDLAGIYPITPSSPMAEHIDEWSNKGRLNLFNDRVKVIEMQSEAGASGLVHGSLQSGCLTSTYTSSQGLLLMIPNMYKIAGEMLPCVIHVAARSLATHALSIFGDHQDINAVRSTGFCILASSSVQDAANLAAVAHLSAISSSLPFLHFFDGFRTSHEIDKIDLLEESDLKPLLDNEALNKFRNRSLNPQKPYTNGMAQNDDVYFQNVESRNKYYENSIEIVNQYMQKINQITNKDYKPFNYYGSNTAESIIVAMGSVCETIKETIDYLNTIGYNVGLVEVHLYRPFSSTYLKKVIPQTVKKVAVLDRTKEQGSIGEPLYLDAKSSLDNIEVVGGRYGLSSKNTTPSDIKAVYDMLKNPINNFTIGIVDDVTNLSLKPSYIKTSTSKEILIYGYGSDGMVSASKSLIKIVGNYTNNYVQGYFQYDSKKSGGVTKCHLRFNDKPIRSTYYIENPSLVVVTKDSYLNMFDCLSNIKENGTFILNTIMSEQEVLNSLSDDIKNILIQRHIKTYIINAYELASKVGLGNKISTIIESAIIKLFDFIDYDMAIDKMKEYAKTTYSKKGNEVVESNYKAITESANYLKKLNIESDFLVLSEPIQPKTVFESIEKRLGDKLEVSKFNPTGTFTSGTSELEKREISDTIPEWISTNCITCGMCSLFCPHGVIRPYLLSEEEYTKSPEFIKNRCLKQGNNYFIIGVSAKDCTGCGVCIKECPGKMLSKALTPKQMTKQEIQNEQNIFDYLNTFITNKNLFPSTSIKGTQFNKPRFAFSGACAGCGETTYIKLLTQITGNNLIISNATGCSSIYGGSFPSTPYTIPWSNSLFEDNAEYGYGILLGNKVIKNRIKNIMESNMDNENKDLFTKWLDNPDDYQSTKEVYNNLTDNIPVDLKPLKDYIVSRVVWTIGGDGWAYDIGFSGIDHVLASNDNVKILVLDTQVYSNTGGQSSKSSHKGSIASFTSSGKQTSKKDLARIAMSYPKCYVAQISLGASPMQAIKVLTEATNYNGPSIVIAYAPCISHGIKGGMVNSVESQKNATKCGYFPIFHYNPLESKFYLDSDANFELYEDYLLSQNRYAMLKSVNPDKAIELMESNRKDSIDRFFYYKDLSKKSVN